MSLDRLDLTETPMNDDIKQQLLHELVQASNVGSGLRMLLEKWHKFSVRKELVVHCIHAFFEILWDKTAMPPVWQKLRLVTVEGQSQEKAFVKIDVSADCIVNRVAPLPARGRTRRSTSPTTPRPPSSARRSPTSSPTPTRTLTPRSSTPAATSSATATSRRTSSTSRAPPTASCRWSRCCRG